MDHFFKGKRVVVTGVMKTPRNEVEVALQRVGALVQGSVVASTDYLICGNKVGARKTEAAEALGVKMLNREDYYAIMDGAVSATAEPVVIKPKLTHAEFVASLPDDYGSW